MGDDPHCERRLDEKRRIELRIPRGAGAMRVIDAIEALEPVRRLRVESA